MDIKELPLGNLEAVLFFNKKDEAILNVIQKIEEYKYDEKHYTGIDSYNYDILFFDNQDELINSTNEFVKKIIYQKPTESIIIESKNDDILLSHFFRYDWYNLQTTGFVNILNFYFSKITDITLVIGFELSINIVDFDETLKETILDTSQHPIYVVTKKEGKIKVDKYTSNIIEQEYDWTIMDNYLKNIIS